MISNRVNPQIILIGTVAFSIFYQSCLVVWGSTEDVFHPFGKQVLRFGKVFVMPHHLDCGHYSCTAHPTVLPQAHHGGNLRG